MTGLPTPTSLPVCLWCSAETSSYDPFFGLKFFLPFAYLPFTSQLTPTALKNFSSSSSHCYGEQDCSSPTPLIFVLELTSVGMANITFRPQEQVVLNCTLYSYTAMLLKYSDFYFHSVRHSLVTAPVHICKIKQWTLFTPFSSMCYVLQTALFKQLFCILNQPRNLLSGIYTALFPHLLYLYAPECAFRVFLIHFFTHTVCICLLLWNLLYIAAYIDRLITLHIISCLSHRPFRPWYLEQWWSSWTSCV